jgi:hypothetical protein
LSFETNKTAMVWQVTGDRKSIATGRDFRDIRRLHLHVYGYKAWKPKTIASLENRDRQLSQMAILDCKFQDCAF